VGNDVVKFASDLESLLDERVLRSLRLLVAALFDLER
jgi:hypothetical protein